MSEGNDIFIPPLKGLTFDVFGTVVNWRKTVISTLTISALGKIPSSSRSASLPPSLRLRLSQLTSKDWAIFAQQWRDSYKEFTHSFVPGKTEWLDIDTHHHLSLIDLLHQWELDGLYSDDEIEELSRVWHFLEPWPDTVSGLKKLGTKFSTSTLSNGNRKLLMDLNESGKLGFGRIQSSADFGAYKPSEKVYRGAVREMGFREGEVAMVAAHLNDLQAAREYGLRTIYVERSGEEDWEVGGEEWTRAREWVDIWISEGEGGFEEVARRLGIV